jgi:hypothetical protein
MTSEQPDGDDDLNQNSFLDKREVRRLIQRENDRPQALSSRFGNEDSDSTRDVLRRS